jgi:hypothetical protein
MSVTPEGKESTCLTECFRFRIMCWQIATADYRDTPPKRSEEDFRTCRLCPSHSQRAAGLCTELLLDCSVVLLYNGGL